MTAPIAGFVRPLPDVASAPVHDNSNVSSTDSNNGSFRTTLESAMKDKPAAAHPRRAERARREASTARSEESPSSRSKANADSTSSSTTAAEAARDGDEKNARSSAEQTLESFVADSLGDRSTLGDVRSRGDADIARDGARDQVSATATRSPDGGAWMRAGVRQRDDVATSGTKGADVDDGVDLSPTLGQGSDAGHFVQTAIVDLASTTLPNVLNNSGESAALASSVAATVANPAASNPNASAIGPADNPDVVRRSVDALAPDLKLRLDRVIDRMKSEFGYSVEVVETVRSQSRQDQLFAQGRTEPGEIVTWTRNSKHTQGRAVDVVIDGSYENAGAYRELAQVAREEGLRSLWPRDGGHLELPGRGAKNESALAQRMAEGESRTSERATAPAVPTQVRAAIDPDAVKSDLPLSLPNKSRRDDSAPVIPKLPSIPMSAADVVLPHAAASRDAGTSSDLLRIPSQQTQSSADGQRDAAARLTKLPVGEQLPPRSGGIAQVAPVAQVARVAEVARVAAVAPVAQLAQVAQVAAVAQVGSVAREAQVGAVGSEGSRERVLADMEQAEGAAQPSTLASGGRGALSTVVTVPGNSRPGAGAHDSNDSKHHASSSKREKSREISSGAASSNSNESVRAFSTREMANAMVKESASSDSVGSLARSDATERIARVLKMQESAGDRPLSSVLLRLDSPDGGEDRVRIDLRGSTIGASFDVSDARAAENLRVHTNELQQALQRQGLEGDSITVRTTQRSTEPVSLNASALAGERAAAGRIGSTAASDGGGSTAKDSRNQPGADDWREGASQQRSRQQRRDGKENR